MNALSKCYYPLDNKGNCEMEDFSVGVIKDKFPLYLPINDIKSAQ